MQLCAQTIRELCEDAHAPLISPFSPARNVVNGKSWGLSAASYDVRIAHDLTLGPNPGEFLLEAVCALDEGDPSTIANLKRKLRSLPPSRALAHTIEDFHFPDNVAGAVCDKSSFARVFVSAFNTFFDPGFQGNATLELVNLGAETVVIKAGDPICQFLFHFLDKPTDRPYRGKYFGQKKGAQPAIYEPSPTFVDGCEQLRLPFLQSTAKS